MKTRIIFLLFCLTIGISSAQNSQPIPFKKGVLAKIDSNKVNIKLSPSTTILIKDFENRRQKIKSANKDIQLTIDTTLINKYGLRKINNVFSVGVFLLVTNEYKSTDLLPYGFIQGTKAGNIVTGQIPIDKIDDLSKIVTVKYVQIGEKATMMLDKARTATFLDNVHLGTGIAQSFKGDGVVVGVIDNGFDYTHPNFYDLTGSKYRIKKVWEQNSTIGVPPIGFSYGRELKTQAEILTANRDMIDQSHGTHVTGIAAGTGGSISTKYMGGAPESEIVLVSTTMKPENIFDGVSYIFDYAQSQGKPCVINISIGSYIGPHDGTAPFDQACDAIIGEGKILVGAAGNEGSNNIFVNKIFTQSDTILCSAINYQTTSKMPAVIDIWGEIGQDFEVGVNLINTNTNSWEAFSESISTKLSTELFDTIYASNQTMPNGCKLAFMSEINPLNNKPHIMAIIDNSEQTDLFRWPVIYVFAKNTKVNMWANGTYNFKKLYENSYWKDGTSTSTIAETGGTGKNIISVGAYTSKNNWIDFNSRNQNAVFNTSLGVIAPFSSKGPTSDGRIKPDITAPGNVIVSSVNSFDTENYSPNSINTVSGITNGSKNWYYGTMQGTSMAAPMVTGIIANWLQANPKLTPSDIKTILQKTSIIDTYYGDSNTWGYGKINALSGLAEAINMGLNMQSVIITQVYGGGGNSGAYYKSDFIELYNTTNTDINIGGCCLYYIAATSSSTTLKYEIPANSIIKANSYFLIKGGDGTGTQPAWNVAFDASCTLNMSGSTGKVILLKSNSAFTLSSTPSIEEIINNVDFMDYVPYGTSAIPIWGSAMVTNTTNTTSARRKFINGNYQYTKNIGNDFEVVTAEPHNSSITTDRKFIDENIINVFLLEKTLYLKGVEYNQKLEIFNTTGLMIHSTILTTNSIPLNNLSSGIYIVRIGEKTFKITL